MLFIDKIFQSLSATIKHWSTGRFLFTIILVQILLHVPVAHEPPIGQHVWRQVMGLAPARNYFEEGNAFLAPAQDVRLAPDDLGIAYIEFPLLYWLIGQSYHLTGFSHVNARLAMLFMGILLIIGSYRFIRCLGFQETRARWYVFFLSCAPYFFYYSITVIPDLPALTWFVWSIALLLPSLRREQWDLAFVSGAMLLILATISKATYLFFGLPIAYLFLCQYFKTKNANILIAGVILGLCLLGTQAFLYGYSGEQVAQAPIERSSWIERGPSELPDSLKQVFETIYSAATKWFLEMYVNTAAIPIFFIGCYTALKQRKWKTEHGKFWLAWLMSFFIFFVIFFIRFGAHEYYQTPLLMVSALASAYGMEQLLKYPKWKLLAGILLLLMPLFMVGRVNARWTINKQVPVELLERAEEFQKIIPPAARVIIAGDDSPVNYLYYLHRKGVLLVPSDNLERFNQYQQYGFKWLVSKGSLDQYPALRQQLSLNHTIGQFYIYQIVTR